MGQNLQDFVNARDLATAVDYNSDNFYLVQGSSGKKLPPGDLLRLSVSRTITDSDVLEIGDRSKVLVANIGTNKNLTINNSIFAAGDIVYVERQGAGTLSFVAGTGVTITTTLGALTDAGANNIMTIRFTASNTCTIYNGAPNTAVPTSRTLAGLDLSTNRTASELNIGLGAMPYISGRLYGTARNYTAPITAVLGANSIRAQPFLVERSMSIDALVAEVTTVGSFNFRLAIYQATSGVPNASDTLIAQVELDGSTPAAPSLRTGAVSVTLEPGLYWLCIVCAGSISFRADSNAAWPTVLGLDNSSQATIRQPYYTLAFTYGSFPANFPGTASINTNAGSGTNAPIVWVKKA